MQRVLCRGCLVILALSVCLTFPSSAANLATVEKTAMNVPRRAAATAVLNGAVYVLGGVTFGDVYVPFAEKYDPASDRWERIADLTFARRSCRLRVQRQNLCDWRL